MLLWNRFWKDESGVVMSAEAVMIGSLGVLGAVAGLSMISHAVDDELKEVGYAIRSLDQSYCFNGHSSCVAWTAGSHFVQPKVEAALADLGARSEADAKALQERIEAYRKQTDSPAKSEEKSKPKKKQPGKKGVKIDESSALSPEPNDLPAPDAAASSY